MVELPKYQRLSRGIANNPQLDFASTREAYMSSQSMQKSLDKISQFAFEKVGEASVREAAQYSINNPPTSEQIELAKSGAISMEDLIPQGGILARETVRKLTAAQLRSQLQVDLDTGYLKTLEQVKLGNITNDIELKAKLNAPIEGMSKVLNDISPEEALRFKAYSANSGFNINVAASKEFDRKFREVGDQVSEQVLSVISATAKETIGNLDLSNPKLIKDQVELFQNNIEKQTEQGTPEGARKVLSAWASQKAGLFTTIVSNGIDDIVRLAATGNPQAEDALFVSLGQFDEASSIFDINPEATEKLKNKTIEDFHSARIKAEYDSVDNKIEFLNKFSADAKAGPVGNLFNKNGDPIKTDRMTRGISVDEIERLKSAFAANINKIDSAKTTQETLLKDRVAELEGVNTNGSTIKDEDIVEVIQLADGLGVLPDSKLGKKVVQLSAINADTKTFLEMTSNDLSQIKSNLNVALGKEGATPLQAERLANLEKFMSAREEALNKDIVVAMSKYGGKEVIPFEWEATKEDFAADTRKRINDTTVFANQNGRSAKYFTNAEKASLSNVFNQSDTKTQAGILVKLTESFGNKSPEALSEIASEAPVIAHLGGLSLSKTPKNIITDALNGIQQTKAGNSPLETYNAGDNKYLELQSELGSAYSNLPKTRAAIIKTTNAIYTQRSITEGLNSFDSSMYAKAFQEAAGAIYTGDEIYGGVIKYKERQIPIPNNINQNDFEDIIENATYEDFTAAANGVLKDDRGRPYSIKALREAVMSPINTDTVYLYAEEYRNKPNALRFYTRDNMPVIINLKKLGNLVKVD